MTAFDWQPPAIVWTSPRASLEAGAICSSSGDIGAIRAWIDRETELSEIGKFDDNWDGYSSPAPDRRTIARAESFLRALKERDLANPPLRIALSPSGSVSIEWLENENLLRAEVSDTDEIEWMMARPGYTTEFQAETFRTDLGSGLGQGQAWPPVPIEAEELDFAFAR